MIFIMKHAYIYKLRGQTNRQEPLSLNMLNDKGKGGISHG